MAKAIAIASPAESELVVVCDDGTMWWTMTKGSMNEWNWEKIPSPPTSHQKEE